LRKITICVLLLTLGIIFTPITVKANDNLNKSELPTAGFTEFISNIDEFYIPPKHEDYLIYNHNGKKTWMGYKTITDKNSNQYMLQQKAYNDEFGFRKIGNRYLVAIGTAFNAQVGQYFDVELNNGTVIECIVGDIKADKDTDKTNMFTSQGCCLEFIVNSKILEPMVKQMGDCSFLHEEWKSPCIKYIVYDIIQGEEK
jgi:hypothetical protein